jgi:hypothetical protein
VNETSDGWSDAPENRTTGNFFDRFDLKPERIIIGFGT